MTSLVGIETGRPLAQALLRGSRCRCPKCGSGPMMRSYLQVRDHCPVCREDLSHNESNDGPAFLTILLVGYFVAPILHIAYTYFRPDPLILLTCIAVGGVALSLYLLPRLKGAMVAYEWARGRNGFRGGRARIQ